MHVEVCICVNWFNSVIHLCFTSLILEDILADLIFLFGFNSLLSGLYST